MRKRSPRTKLFIKKYIEEFNPKNPSIEVMELFNNTKLPSSSYLNTSTRGKNINELSLDQLEYVAYNLKNGSEKMKLICRLRFLCKLYNDREEEGITEKEFDSIMEDEFKKENDEIDF